MRTVRLVKGIPTVFIEESYDRKYDESIYFSEEIPPGTSIYLPNEETYVDETSILVIFNSIPAEAGRQFLIPEEGEEKDRIITIDSLPVDSVIRFKKM